MNERAKMSILSGFETFQSKIPEKKSRKYPWKGTGAVEQKEKFLTFSIGQIFPAQRPERKGFGEKKTGAMHTFLVGF